MKAVLSVLLTLGSTSAATAWTQPASVPSLARIDGSRPRSIVLIVADDHRYDALRLRGTSVL